MTSIGISWDIHNQKLKGGQHSSIKRSQEPQGFNPFAARSVRRTVLTARGFTHTHTLPVAGPPRHVS